MNEDNLKVGTNILIYNPNTMTYVIAKYNEETECKKLDTEIKKQKEIWEQKLKEQEEEIIKLKRRRRKNENNNI